MTPPNIQLESASCPNGCAGGDKFLFNARDRINGLPGDYTLQQCKSCRLVRTSPRPTPSSIGYYYPDNYGPYGSTEVQDQTVTPKRGALFRLARAVARRTIRLNTEVLPPVPVGRLLEFGCASGSFLAHMAGQGWAVSGIEFSDSAATKARALGFDVQTGSIESASVEADHFNLIVGWMVLEHLHDPQVALSKFAQWSAPGGWLVLSTPNAGSLDFRLFKGAGYALHLPNHLFHFDPATLSYMLERCGWRVRRVFHQRVLGNYLGGLGNLLEDLRAPRALSEFLKNLPARRGYLNHVLYPVAWILSLFGQTGRMTVWAQKIDPEGRT
jgi:2-polyprenyl-3-methyl-5-hydroxy-6-metoxy-1,4-benzoquinol methylase